MNYKDGNVPLFLRRRCLRMMSWLWWRVTQQRWTPPCLRAARLRTWPRRSQQGPAALLMSRSPRKAPAAWAGLQRTGRVKQERSWTTPRCPCVYLRPAARRAEVRGHGGVTDHLKPHVPVDNCMFFHKSLKAELDQVSSLGCSNGDLFLLCDSVCFLFSLFELFFFFSHLPS